MKNYIFRKQKSNVMPNYAILGVGVDLCDTKRIDKIVKKLGIHFCKYLLTDSEIKQGENKKDFTKFLSLRFAAKEAFYKAFCLPCQKYLFWKDVEILYKSNNQLSVKLSPKVDKYLQEFLPKQSEYNILLSVAYYKDIIICKAIIQYSRN